MFQRMRLWFRWLRRCRLEPVGLHHLPTDGPVLLVTTIALFCVIAVGLLGSG